MLAFHLWPTIFAGAPFRLQNICGNGVPPRSRTTTHCSWTAAQQSTVAAVPSPTPRPTTLRPMSHLRFCRMSARLYRVTKSQSQRLSSCTLRLCRVNKHGFRTTFPVSRSSFTNTVPKWRNRFISNLFRTLRLIVRFHFARQPTKTKLIPRISYLVMLVWFVY